jgi:hypothetical protein
MSRTLPYLQRRGGVLHFRIAVPAKLRQALGAAEITQSLHTAESSVAAPMALELAARAKRAYLSRSAGEQGMNREKFHSFLREWSAEMRFDEERAAYEARLAELQEKHRAELHLARLEATHEAVHALAGARDPSLGLDAGALTPSVGSPPSASDAPMLSKVVDTFLTTGPKASGAAMLKKHRTVLPLLVSVVGDKRVNQIKQADLNRFFDLVCHLPPRWVDVCRKRKITPVELATLGEGELAPKTFEDT